MESRVNGQSSSNSQRLRRVLCCCVSGVLVVLGLGLATTGIVFITHSTFQKLDSKEFFHVGIAVTAIGMLATLVGISSLVYSRLCHRGKRNRKYAKKRRKPKLINPAAEKVKKNIACCGKCSSPKRRKTPGDNSIGGQPLERRPPKQTDAYSNIPSSGLSLADRIRQQRSKTAIEGTDEEDEEERDGWHTEHVIMDTCVPPVHKSKSVLV